MGTKKPTNATPLQPQVKLYPNRRGILGWIDSRHLNMERYFYTIHRLGGLFLVGYLFVHVYTTSTRLQGQPAWDSFLFTIENPYVYAGEWLLVAVVAFHGLNGIRLILAELGLSVGKPKRPVYPHKPTTLGRRQRYFIWILMIVGGMLLLGTALEYLVYVPLAHGG